jgi:hypothetical protein
MTSLQFMKVNSLNLNSLKLSSWMWTGPFGSLGLLWYECREDLSLFCYRIGCGALTEVRSRALEFAPFSQALSTLSQRKSEACSNFSSICSALPTTQRHLKN